MYPFCCDSTTAESMVKAAVHLGDGSVVVDSSLIVTPIVGFCICSMFCCALLCGRSNFAIILNRKRELVALLCLTSWCL